METTKRCLLIGAVCFGVALVCTLVVPPTPLASSGCGPRSLYAVAKAMGVSCSEQEVRRRFILPENKVSFAEIENAAHFLGLQTQGRLMTIAELRQTKPLGIVHIDPTHFVGIVGYDSQTIHIAETGYADGLYYQRWTDGDLAASWNGRILIVMHPSPNSFTPRTSVNEK